MRIFWIFNKDYEPFWKMTVVLPFKSVFPMPKKARKLGVNIWNNASRQLLLDLSIPLATGGIFMLILILQGYFTTLAATCLLFYGVALTNASRHTFKEVMYLGICEILLGLTAAFLPGYGLIFWALGFGVLHILYGALMHYRYDQ